MSHRNRIIRRPKNASEFNVVMDLDILLKLFTIKCVYGILIFFPEFQHSPMGPKGRRPIGAKPLT